MTSSQPELPKDLVLAWNDIDPNLPEPEKRLAFAKLIQEKEAAQQKLAGRQQESEQTLSSQEVSRRDARLERSGHDIGDIYIRVGVKGGHLPHTKLAGQEFNAEDVKFKKTEMKDIAAAVKTYAAQIMAGDKPGYHAVVEKLDAVATFLELAPEGVKFSAQGRPDLTPFTQKQVHIERGLNGKYEHDSRMANEAAGISGTQWIELSKDYVWHHVEDGKTMQLVPKEIHNLVGHVAGAYAIRNGIELAPAMQQVIAEAYEKQAEYQPEVGAGVAAPDTVARSDVAYRPEPSVHPHETPSAYAQHVQDGVLRTQFAVGDGVGPLGHGDFRKDEIGRLVHDPEIKTINGHDRERYAGVYDRAQEAALERGATPEQARLAAQDHTAQTLARVEMMQERAALRQQPYRQDVKAHFSRLGQLRDQRIQDLSAQAQREGRTYSGPGPKAAAQRQFEARTGAHVFVAYAKLEIYKVRYSYGPGLYREKRTGLDRSIAEYRQRERQAFEREHSALISQPPAGLVIIPTAPISNRAAGLARNFRSQASPPERRNKMGEKIYTRKVNREGIPPTDEDVALVEQEIGHKLPADYVELMRDLKAEYPMDNSFPDVKEISEGVGLFLPFKEKIAIKFGVMEDWLKEDLRTDRPPALLPFADTGTGNYFCLLVDESSPDYGAVYYWDMEQVAGENGLARVAGSITELMRNMRYWDSDVEMAKVDDQYYQVEYAVRTTEFDEIVGRASKKDKPENK